MEIKDEEFNALNEALTLLQQVEIKGGNNIFLMSGIISRIQGVLQEVSKRKQEEMESKKEG